MPASPIRKLMPLADDGQAAGRPRLPPQHRPARPRDARRRCASGCAQLPRPRLAYTPSGGTPEYLRHAAASTTAALGIALGLDELIATTGGSEAILFALLACANEGDEALVVEPFYTNYTAFATMAGVRLVPLTSRGRGRLPPAAARGLGAARSRRARALVILCNPNNPTGTVYTRGGAARWWPSFCRDHGLFLISDEVYREFVYDGRTADRARSTLAGLRGPRDRGGQPVQALQRLRHPPGLPGHPQPRGARRPACAWPRAASRAPGLAQVDRRAARASWAPSTRAAWSAEYQKRRDVLFEGLAAIPGVFLRKPEGAFYFVARLPVRDSEDFARWLLTDFQQDGATVMVAPAPGFYATPGLGADEVRIAYVLKEGDLRASVAILAAALPAYRKARGLESPPRRRRPRTTTPTSTCPPRAEANGGSPAMRAM